MAHFLLVRVRFKCKEQEGHMFKTYSTHPVDACINNNNKYL